MLMRDFILISLALFTVTATSEVCQWKGKGDGIWSDPKAWSCNRIPSLGDSVIIHKHSVSITKLKTVSVSMLSLENSGNLVLASGNRLMVNESIRIALGCELHVRSGSILSGLNNRITMTNAGTLKVSGRLSMMSITTSNLASFYADFTVDSSVLFETLGASSTKIDSINAQVGGKWMGSLTNKGDIYFNINTILWNGKVNNLGTIVFDSPGIFTDRSQWTNSGKMIWNSQMTAAELDLQINAKSSNIFSPALPLQLRSVRVQNKASVQLYGPLVLSSNSVSNWGASDFPPQIMLGNNHTFIIADKIKRNDTEFVIYDKAAISLPADFQARNILVSGRNSNLELWASQNSVLRLDTISADLNVTVVSQGSTPRSLDLQCVSSNVKNWNLKDGSLFSFYNCPLDISSVNGFGSLYVPLGASLALTQPKVLNVEAKIEGRLELQSTNQSMLLTSKFPMYFGPKSFLFLNYSSPPNITMMDIIKASKIEVEPTAKMGGGYSCFKEGRIIVVEDIILRYITGLPNQPPPTFVSIAKDKDPNIIVVTWKIPEFDPLCLSLVSFSTLDDNETIYDTTQATKSMSGGQTQQTGISWEDLPHSDTSYRIGMTCRVLNIPNHFENSYSSYKLFPDNSDSSTHSSNTKTFIPRSKSKTLSTIIPSTQGNNSSGDEDGKYKLTIALGFLGSIIVIIIVSTIVMYILNNLKPAKIIKEEDEDEDSLMDSHSHSTQEWRMDK